MCNSCNKHAYLMICHHANHSWIVSRNSDDNFSPLLKSRQNAEKNDHFQKEKMNPPLQFTYVRSTVECRFATQSIKPSSSDKKLSSVAPHDGLTNRLVQKVNVPCHAKIILGDDKETDEEQRKTKVFVMDQGDDFMQVHFWK